MVWCGVSLVRTGGDGGGGPRAARGFSLGELLRGGGAVGGRCRELLELLELCAPGVEVGVELLDLALLHHLLHLVLHRLCNVLRLLGRRRGPCRALHLPLLRCCRLSSVLLVAHLLLALALLALLLLFVALLISLSASSLPLTVLACSALAALLFLLFAVATLPAPTLLGRSLAGLLVPLLLGGSLLLLALLGQLEGLALAQALLLALDAAGEAGRVHLSLELYHFELSRGELARAGRFELGETLAYGDVTDAHHAHHLVHVTLEAVDPRRDHQSCAGGKGVKT